MSPATSLCSRVFLLDCIMIKFIIKALVIIGTAYVLAAMALYFLQRSFMYPAPKGHPGLKSTSLSSLQEITLNTSDGHSIPIWWHPPEDGEKVVVFFHGNGSSVYDGRFIYQHFIEQGFGVLGAEYPGYPNASGKPTENGLINGALAQYDFISEQGVNPDDIYLYGTSLGAGVAAQLASRRKVGKIVMEAPFNSMMDMVRVSMPIFAVRPLVKDKYESHKALKNQTVPMLWVHGTLDRVIPLSQGQKLFDGYTGPKTKLIVPNGNHNDLWISGAREAITEFFK